MRVLDTRLDIGLSNAFQANTNRVFQVAGSLTVPADAVAVTGNLTVIGQTGAGFVTLSSTPPPANPTTSTINFPIGDTRANGVTIKLSEGTNPGRIHAVYKAPPGKTAHLHLRRHRLLRRRRLRRPVRAAHAGSPHGYPGYAQAAEGLIGPFAANVARTLVIGALPGRAGQRDGDLRQPDGRRADPRRIRVDDPGHHRTTRPPRRSTSRSGHPGERRDRAVDAAGNVGLVYKASGGQTHLILDLTGYFR